MAAPPQSGPPSPGRKGRGGRRGTWCSLPFPPPAPGCGSPSGRILLPHTSERRRASAAAGGEREGSRQRGRRGWPPPRRGRTASCPPLSEGGRLSRSLSLGRCGGVNPALIYKLRPGGRGQKARGKMGRGCPSEGGPHRGCVPGALPAPGTAEAAGLCHASTRVRESQPYPG